MNLKDLNDKVREFLSDNYPDAEYATVVIQRGNESIPPTQITIPWKPKTIEERRETKAKAKKAAA